MRFVLLSALILPSLVMLTSCGIRPPALEAPEIREGMPTDYPAIEPVPGEKKVEKQ